MKDQSEYDSILTDSEDKTFNYDTDLKEGDIVEIRFSPNSTKASKLQINCGDYEDVYEAACWVRARVKKSSTSINKSLDLTFNVADAEFYPLIPSDISFDTHPSNLEHGILNNIDHNEEMNSDLLHASPYSVSWHLYLSSTPITNLSHRDVRSIKHPDNKFVTYIKDQPVEVFLRSSASLSKGNIDSQDGIWVLGFIRENAACEANIKVHIFGNYNNHTALSNNGPHITPAFGYGITSDRTVPIVRAIRFVGNAPNGKPCHFGTDDLSGTFETADTRPNSSPPISIYARVLSSLILIGLLIGIIFGIYFWYPVMVPVYGGIFSISVAALTIFTSMMLLLVSMGVGPAIEAIRFLSINPSSNSSTSLSRSAVTDMTLLLWLPFLLIFSIAAWAVVVSPFWLISYLIEGVAKWPWWSALLLDLVFLVLSLWLIFTINEMMIRKQIKTANDDDANPLSDFIAARQLEELREMNTFIV